MAVVTLEQFQKRERPTLVSAVIDSMVKRAPIMRFLPITGVEGLKIEWNELTNRGGVVWVKPDGSADPHTNFKAAMTTSLENASVCEVVGQVELGHGVAKNAAEVQRNLMIRSGAMSEEWANQFINGDGTDDKIKGLGELVSTASPDQQIEGGTNGDTMTLDLVDEVIAKVSGGSGGTADILEMSENHVNKFRSLLRTAGGASIAEYKALENPINMDSPSFLMYNGTIVLPNAHIGTYTKDSGTCSSLFAYKLDDGTRTRGVSGIIPDESQMPIEVVYGGPAKDAAFYFWQVIMLMGLANFNKQALAVRKDILVA